MKITPIVHVGQMDIFPHITVSLGYVDEFGNEHDDATLIYIGWLSFDLCIEIPKTNEQRNK